MPGLGNRLSRGWVVAIIAIMFASTVALRTPLLVRPLGSDQDWLTSTVLRTQAVWWEKGALTLKFLPTMSWPGAANKYINNSGYLVDASGNYYYTSYPSLSYIVPYVVFKAVQLPPSPLALRLFNMFFDHLLGTIFLYLLVMRLARDRDLGARRVAALLAVAVYLFSPLTLWFQSGVYMADMFAQPFFVLAAYLAVRARQEEAPAGLVVLLGVCVFLMTWAEWIGVLFAATLVLWCAFCRFERRSLRLALSACAGAVAAIGVTVAHYSLVDGLRTYVTTAVQTYFYRSGVSGVDAVSVTSLGAWARVAGYYVRGWPIAILLLLGLGAWGIVIRRRGSATGVALLGLDAWMALFVTWVPVALHHVVFFNFTAFHNFSTMKTALPIAVTVYLLVMYVADQARPKARTRALLVGAMVVVIVGGSAQFARQHQTEWLGPSAIQLGYLAAGEQIRTQTPDDRVAFAATTDTDVYPQVIWNAKRNVAIWKGPEAAAEIIRRTGSSGGVLYSLNPEQTGITRVQTVRPDGRVGP